jgi:hypothetical protein
VEVEVEEQWVNVGRQTSCPQWPEKVKSVLEKEENLLPLLLLQSLSRLLPQHRR